MSRFHFSVLMLLVMILSGLCIIEKSFHQSLPLINLPIEAHNTIGEMPLVSQMDSGGVDNITPRKGWGYIQITPMISGSTIAYVGNNNWNNQ